MDVDVKIVDGAGAVTVEGAAATVGGTVATIGGDGEIVFITTEDEVKPEPEVKHEPGKQFDRKKIWLEFQLEKYQMGS